MKTDFSLTVFFQLLFITLFLLTGPLFALHIPFLIIELFAMILGVWGMLHMWVKSKFRALPAPDDHAKLLATGPFKYIRNPMYAAIILAMALLVADNFTLTRLVLFLMETFVLLQKIGIEEKLLAKKFKAYAYYKAHTRRLIPFVY